MTDPVTPRDLHHLLWHGASEIPGPILYVTQHVKHYGGVAGVPAWEVAQTIAPLIPALRATRPHTMAEAVAWAAGLVGATPEQLAPITYGDLPLTIEHAVLDRLGRRPGDIDHDDVPKYEQWLLVLKEMLEHFKKDLNE